MPKLIRELLVACGLALATATLCVPAMAAEPAKKPVKAKAKKAKEKHPKAVDVLPDEPEPDITDSTTTDYACELNNKVTIYHNDNDPAHIALRWKKRLHRLDRVGTTTGALRFENVRYGLVWIGIPSKGMLLDSKLNRQLANECKNDEQAAQDLVEAEEAKTTSAQ
ncbi:MliC family protein [Massilia sp. GCM10020059]|uniref:MliC family protein n=1 Tax=Massilia agrisoli TaxID=2892444 RepID=A0ABS8ISG6_9BURK|nr:MliC family protein [Massilia agrisoli]MCC6071597.1 MliC family protein [Massilia agrisoli]